MTSLGVLTGLRAAALARTVAGAPEAVVTQRRVHHRPGADTTVTFAVTAAGVEHMVVLTDADVADAPGVREVGEGLRGWVHPADPRLPALAQALDRHVVGDWLGASVGQVELLAYRPLRRAVVRAVTGAGVVYLKLWRPTRAAGLIRRHELLDAAQIGPSILARPAPGLIVIADAEGVSLGQALSNRLRGHAPPPAPAAIIELLDRLPAGLLAFEARPAWSDRADFYGRAAAELLPGSSHAVERLAGRVAELVRETATLPCVPTHGDFYEANIFVSERRLALIDVDTAGPGRRVDDLACLLGHLAVLPDLSPRHFSRLDDVLTAWTPLFEERVGAAALRARVAGVILSLIPGTPPERAAVRLDLAQQWLHRADI